MTTGQGLITGVSVAHDRASVDELGGATVESHRRAVERLCARDPVEEAYVIQTCNRVEGYVVTPDEASGRAALADLTADVPDDVVVEMGHEESLRHLMRVASGLESLVLGEDQILGQVRDAYEDARRVGGIGPVLEEGITKAIHVGERARTETAINEGTVSMASAAVRLASEELDLPLGEATALVVGAGEMGRLATKNLAPRVDELLVANRTVPHAEHLVGEVDVPADAVGLDALQDATDEADLVITATGSNDTVFDQDAFADAGETLVVDLAQPRDVPGSVAACRGVTVQDIDALRTVTDRNREKRREAAVEVEAMIDEEFEHLLARYKRKRADDVISAMYESAERVKAQEVETALAKADLDDDEREVVESMADAIVSQLLAPPTKSLRDAAEQDDWSTINTALQLFDPDFGPDSVAPPGFTESPGSPGPAAPEDVDPDDIPEHVREEMPDPVLDRLTDD